MRIVKWLLLVAVMVFVASLFCIKVIADTQNSSGRTISNDVNNQSFSFTNKVGSTPLTFLQSLGSTGGVNLGVSVSANNYSNPKNTVYGSIFAGGSGSADQSGYMMLGSNVWNGAALNGRFSTGTGGSSIVLQNRSSDSIAAISVYTNNVGDALTGTAPDLVGQVTQRGDWSLGINGSDNSHIQYLYGSARVVAPSSTHLEVVATGGAPSGYADLYLDAFTGYTPRIIFEANNVATGRLSSDGSYALRVQDGSGNDRVRVESGGAVTLVNPTSCGNVCASQTSVSTSNNGGSVTASSITGGEAIWMRVGNIVTMTISASFTSNPSYGSFQVSLPVASNFVNATDAGGSCSYTYPGFTSFADVIAETTDNRLRVNTYVGGTTTYYITCSSQYVIK